MKKILSLILALALVMSLSINALAAEDNGNGEGEAAKIEISAIYRAGTAADEVVSVDITWGAMSFTYTDGADGKWDPATHSYGEKGTGTWKASDNAITVTNHSNTGIKASFTYTKAVETVTGTFSATELTLDTAEGTTKENAPAGSVTLELGGTMTAEDAGKVGTVTISIENT